MNDVLTYLQSCFFYVKGQPVIFTQLYFWGFFVVVLGIYSLIYKKNTLRTFYLLLVSFFFYYKTSGVTIANFKAAVVAIDNFQKDFLR